MNLKLSKPIAFIDLETTGTNLATDRIVELAIVRVSPDGVSTVKRKLINPLMAIPKGASDIHGITNEMVKDAPTFKQVANEVKQLLRTATWRGITAIALTYQCWWRSFCVQVWTLVLMEESFWMFNGYFI